MWCASDFFCCDFYESKTMVMYMGDIPKPLPSSLTATLLILPHLLYTWAHKFLTMETSIWTSREVAGWSLVSWKISGDHYSNVMTSCDAPSYEFIKPPSTLCYYMAPRHDLLARPLSPTSITSSLAPSGASRGCTGPVLCPMKSSAPLLSAMFTGLVMSCDDLMTTQP